MREILCFKTDVFAFTILTRKYSRTNIGLKLFKQSNL